MPKIKSGQKKWLKLLKEYGIHFWVILVLVNATVLYTVHFFLMASTCMTTQQVAADNRCLYIWGKQVFVKGTRAEPHYGHPCGTDVTSVIPASHIGNQASYMLPNYVANICTAAVAPTPTPTPKPTSTPVPTVTKAPTPTIAPSPTPKPNAAAAPTVELVLASTSTPTIDPPTPSFTKNAVSAVPSASEIPSILPSDTPTEAPPTPTPTPRGPVIDISFSLPGIGSGGAVLQPLHTTRNVSIYMYATDVNTADKSVQPIYTVKTQATYDTDPNSPTYTSFVNHYVDLGPIADGSYQVVLKADQTLPQLVKSSDPNSVGGEIISFNSNQNVIPHQIMFMGDIAPSPNGDGKIDIADYSAFVECYGAKADTPSCPSKQAADLDDNGVVDGVDYNLLLLGFQRWLSLGYTVPVLSIAPTLTPTAVPIPTAANKPSKTPVQASSSGKLTVSPTSVNPQKPTPVVAGSNASVVLSKLLAILAFMTVLGVGILGAYKSKFIAAGLQRFGITLPVFPLHKNTQPQIDEPKTETNQAAPPVETQGDTQPTDQAIVPEQTAPSVEQPTIPADSTQSNATAIDKTYFVKNKSKDEKGIWVTLTDDNGPVDGFYTGGEIADGFMRIKGVQKTEGEKTYIEISEVLPSE
jgi:hypothetical protein